MERLALRRKTPLQRLIWLKRLTGGGGTPPVEKTVSGSLIHVEDALARNAKNLVVNIKAVQSGSGDPSPTNIRPITGLAGCNVYRSGADTTDYTTYPIAFSDEAGTVYGGTLHVTTGELTVTHKARKISDFTWSYQSSSTAFRAAKNSVADEIFSKSDGQDATDSVCSVFTNAYGATSISTIPNYSYKIGASTLSSYRLFIHDEDYTDVNSWLAARGNEILMYKIKEPPTYQLTRTQIAMLLGENYLWTNAGDIELTYLAST